MLSNTRALVAVGAGDAASDKAPIGERKRLGEQPRQDQLDFADHAGTAGDSNDGATAASGPVQPACSPTIPFLTSW